MKTQIDEITNEIKSLEKQIRVKEFERFQATEKPNTEDRLARRQRLRNLKYKTKNGLSVYALRKAGHKVKITHIRYQNNDDISVLVPAPSYLRGIVDFYPRGGVTYLVINSADKQQFAASSICHTADCFDYKLGVKLCLDQITQAEADYLLSFPVVTEQVQTVEEVIA